MQTRLKQINWKKVSKKLSSFLFLCALFFVIVWLYDAVANRRYLQREYVYLKDQYDIVAFGDSLTEGVGAANTRGYVSRLGEEYSVDILNKGIRRHQSKHLLERVDRDVLAYKPKVVVMTVGGNDVLRGVPFETFAQNLRTLFTIFKNNDITVLYLGVKTSRFGDDNQTALQALCDSFDNVVYVPNVLDGILFNPFLLSDMIHPDDEGYQQITQKVAPFFEQLLVKREIPFVKTEVQELSPFDGPSLLEQLRRNAPVEFNRTYNPLHW